MLLHYIGFRQNLHQEKVSGLKSEKLEFLPEEKLPTTNIFFTG
jgi:hypothetical protein